MRILVTGSRGFLGSRLLHFLRETSPQSILVGASRRPKDAGELICRFDQVPSVKKTLMSARPDLVFHCVGTTVAGPWEKLNRAHLQPTIHLMEAVRSLPGKPPRIVILGSAAEYGSGRPQRRFNENTPPRPETLYGLSKSLQTAIAMLYAQRGVPVLVARLFNLLAPEAPLTFAVSRVVALLRKIPKGTTGEVSVGPRGSVRDFVLLRDVFRALVLLGARGRPGEIYNICSGKGLRMGDLFDALAAGVGVRVSWVSDGQGSVRSQSTYSVGDFGKIHRHVGWTPTGNVLEEAKALMMKFR